MHSPKFEFWGKMITIFANLNLSNPNTWPVSAIDSRTLLQLCSGQDLQFCFELDPG